MPVKDTARCSIDGCGDYVFSRGWCSRHYSRWRTNGDPLRLIRTPGCECGECPSCRSRVRQQAKSVLKPCRKCGEPRKRGGAPYCAPCTEKSRLARKKRLKRTLREAELRRVYGISIADYAAMFDAQKGLCAICGKPPTRSYRSLDIDHNHATGKVRGLLCRRCNIALSYMEDGLLEERLAYLERYSS